MILVSNRDRIHTQFTLYLLGGFLLLFLLFATVTSVAGGSGLK